MQHTYYYVRDDCQCFNLSIKLQILVFDMCTYTCMTMIVVSYATVPVRKLNEDIFREWLIWEQATKVRHYLVCLGTQVDELSKWTVPIGVLEMVGIHTGPMGDHIQVVGGRHGNNTSSLEIQHTDFP